MNNKQGAVQTIFGSKRYMSVAKIKRMNKKDLDLWLSLRGFSATSFSNNKEKVEALIEDLLDELSA